MNEYLAYERRHYATIHRWVKQGRGLDHVPFYPYELVIEGLAT